MNTQLDELTEGAERRKRERGGRKEEMEGGRGKYSEPWLLLAHLALSSSEGELGLNDHRGSTSGTYPAPQGH